ncbi:MAG: hypothetical protein ACRCXA_02465 [Peptostreptococcaceae bacterium]
MLEIGVTTLFALMVFWIVYKFFKEKQYSNESTLGNISSTIGILGTFIGISIGLWKFDPYNITESVPMLLTGMKIAFATSIVGMSGSMVMKYVAMKNEDDEDIYDIIELFNTMIKESREVNETLIKNQAQTEDVLNKVSKLWISSQREFTENLANELHSLNINSTNKQNELISEFKKLGETFTELNNGVSNMLKWQEHYKETIELTTEELKRVVKSISYVDESIKRISENSTLIKENNDNLNDVLKDIKYSQSIIVDGTKSIINISREASDSIPLINTYFEKANESFREEVVDYLEQLKGVISILRETIPEANTYLQKSTRKFNNTLINFTREIESNLEQNVNYVNEQMNMLNKSTISMNTNLENTISESTKRVENITKATSNQIKIMVDDMEDIFTRKIDRLDETLERELMKSLNSLGEELASISSRFADDYIPLADKLKEVVYLAEGVK